MELDKQGRFVIPQNLIDYANISLESKEVVFLGLGRWVEVWDVNKWEERKNYLAKNSGVIAEKLSEVNI